MEKAKLKIKHIQLYDSRFFFFSRICRLHDSRGDKLIMYWKQRRGSFESLHILWTPDRRRSLCWSILSCWHNLIHLRAVAKPTLRRHIDRYWVLMEHLLNNFLSLSLFRDSSLPASKANVAMRWKLSSPRPARKRWYLKMTYRKWIPQNSTKSRTWPSWRVWTKHPFYTISRIDTTLDWSM